MKVSELRDILAKLPDGATVHLVSETDGDEPLSFISLSCDGRWLMLGGPEAEEQPKAVEKVIWDGRPEPGLD